MTQKTFWISLAAAAAIVVASAAYLLWPRAEWTADEVATLRGLSIGSLPALPPDPSNKVADDPRAVALGQKLFFDTRLSSNGKVACASCHLPQQGFQDGKPLGQGIGTTTRRTMPIAGTAYSPWLFWDGRKDSLWAQALGPLENPVEHGGSRTPYAHLIERNVAERAPYMHAGQFGSLREVLDHYNRAPAAPFGHSELKPLNLSEQELAQLEAFLRSLSGPLNTPPELLAPLTPPVACLSCHSGAGDQSVLRPSADNQILYGQGHDQEVEHRP
jgi:cytochrome c peroxidase